MWFEILKDTDTCINWPDCNSKPEFYDKKLYIPDNPYIYNTSSSKSFSRYLDLDKLIY